jgi:hypothetical protein
MFRLTLQVIHPPLSGTGLGTVACVNCCSCRCQNTHQTPLNILRPWVPHQLDPSMQYSEGEVVEVRGFCFENRCIRHNIVYQVRFRQEGQAPPYWAQGRISGGPVSNFPPSYFVIFHDETYNNTFSTTRIRKASGLPRWCSRRVDISIPSYIVEHAGDSLAKVATLRQDSTGRYFIRLIFDVADELCARENFKFRISQLERIADLVRACVQCCAVLPTRAVCSLSKIESNNLSPRRKCNLLPLENKVPSTMGLCVRRSSCSKKQ